MHWAVRRNHVDVATLLMRNGADIEAIDMGLRTPLLIAV